MNLWIAYGYTITGYRIGRIVQAESAVEALEIANKALFDVEFDTAWRQGEPLTAA